MSCLCIVTAFAHAQDKIPADKAVITLTPKFGPVTFSHQRHSDLEGVRCVTCHHTSKDGNRPVQSCYDCHEAIYFSIAAIRKAERESSEDAGSQVANAQQAFHGLCAGCNKQRHEQQLPAGPHDSCRDCHK